jgi:hypothetical protein
LKIRIKVKYAHYQHNEQVNSMNNKVILTTSLLAVLVIGTYGPMVVAFGEAYMGNVGDKGETGARTLEEALEIQHRRVIAAQANPASGSGTPYLDASGVVGASVISAAIFGGIAAAFFIRGRSGKYAAMGRG